MTVSAATSRSKELYLQFYSKLFFVLLAIIALMGLLVAPGNAQQNRPVRRPRPMTPAQAVEAAANEDRSNPSPIWQSIQREASEQGPRRSYGSAPTACTIPTPEQAGFGSNWTPDSGSVFSLNHSATTSRRPQNASRAGRSRCNCQGSPQDQIVCREIYCDPTAVGRVAEGGGGCKFPAHTRLPEPRLAPGGPSQRCIPERNSLYCHWLASQATFARRSTAAPGPERGSHPMTNEAIDRLYRQYCRPGRLGQASSNTNGVRDLPRCRTISGMDTDGSCPDSGELGITCKRSAWLTRNAGPLTPQIDFNEQDTESDNPYINPRGSTRTPYPLPASSIPLNDTPPPPSNNQGATPLYID